MTADRADRLFDLPPASKLTDRQTVALAAITTAGYDGLHTDELGAVLHAFRDAHSAEDRCEFCGSAGQSVGKALRAKGLVQQRRRKGPGGDRMLVWTVAGRLVRAVADPDVDPWPEGF